MQLSRMTIVLAMVSGLVVSAGAVPLQADDCNGNGIPDECDIDCGPSGGPCDVPGCGESEDCNSDGIPDECRVAWTLASEDGPSPRAYPAVAFDAARNVTLVFGGSDANAPGAPLGDTWVWDGATWMDVSTNGSPSPRYVSALAYDQEHEVTVLFGGWDGAYRNDTWVWDGTTWEDVTTNGSPSLRGYHAMAYDAKILGNGMGAHGKK